MKFLNPIALWGLVAASIPVIIHLLNLRKIKKVEFSSLQFLKEIENSSIRKIKIKQWLLLVIRTLIIIFTILALSRPTLTNSNYNSFSNLDSKTSIIIIDNSVSTLFDTDNGSIFNKEKKIISNYVNSLSKNDKLFIISNDDVHKFENVKDLAKIENSIKSLNISYKLFDLKNSLSKSKEIINNLGNYNNEILILTDSKFPTVEPDSIKSKFHLNIFYIDLSYRTTNTGIIDAKVNSKLLNQDRELNVSTVIKNYSNSTINNKVLSVFVNGKRASQKSFNLEPKEEKNISVNFKLSRDEYNEIKFEIESDVVQQDNYFFLAVRYPKKIEVGYIGEKIPSFLFNALDTSSIALTTIKPYNVDISDLKSKDILVINSENLTQSALIKIKQFDKGIIYFPTASNRVDNINNLTQKLFNIKTLSIDDFNPYFNIKINKKNSVLMNNIFKNINEVNSLDIKVYKSYYFSDKIGSPQLLISNNRPFVTLVENKNIIFSVPFNLKWTDFYLSGLFPVIINKSILFLAAGNIQRNGYYVGDKITFNPSLINKPIIVEYPNGEVFKPNIIEESKNTFSKANIPGIYKIKDKESLFDIFYVNINPKEFISKLSEKEINKIFARTSLDINYINKNDNFIKTINNSRLGYELWKIFIIAAILLVIFEMIISKGSRKGNV